MFDFISRIFAPVVELTDKNQNMSNLREHGGTFLEVTPQLSKDIAAACSKGSEYVKLRADVVGVEDSLIPCPGSSAQKQQFEDLKNMISR